MKVVVTIMCAKWRHVIVHTRHILTPFARHVVPFGEIIGVIWRIQPDLSYYYTEFCVPRCDALALIKKKTM